MFNKKHALDDDFESLRNVTTESNVDYLSYKFDEMDLAVSWRVLTKQKLNIANGIRLENASWRTWAKQRNNLKTVSPDTLNWLKDSDVTWLYGPLHTVIKEIGDNDRFVKPKVSTTEDTFGLMTTRVVQKEEEPKPNNNNASPPIQKPLKSALKKVTMSDLLKRSVSELQINNSNSSNANSSEVSLSEANQQVGAFSPSVIASHRQPKLRFNQYVEQCVALTSNNNSNSNSNNNNNKKKRMIDLNREEEDDEEEDETTSSNNSYERSEEESDTNSIIVMRRPKIKSSIKKIEPTLLKTNSRSDPDLSSNDSSDEEDFIPTVSRYHRRKSNKQINKNNVADWDLESAESDALVNHIISVSKGKQPTRHKDPAADRIPVTVDDWDTNQDDDNDIQQTKSDYDYEFDDDDWDTHSEHIQDEYPTTFSSSNNNNTTNTLPKTITVDKPSKTESENNSLFSQIAHWASSHFWPAGEK